MGPGLEGELVSLRGGSQPENPYADDRYVAWNQGFRSRSIPDPGCRKCDGTGVLHLRGDSKSVGAYSGRIRCLCNNPRVKRTPGGRDSDFRRLIQLALANDLSGLRAEIDGGHHPDDQGPNHITALMMAARDGNVAMVELILSRGSNPKAASAEFNTALNYTGSRPIAQMLLESGACYIPLDRSLELRAQVDPHRLSTEAVGERALSLEDQEAVTALVLPGHELWYAEDPGNGPLSGGGGWVIVFNGVPVRMFSTWVA